MKKEIEVDGIKYFIPVAPYTEEEHQELHQLNLPHAERIAMMCAFELTKRFLQGKASPDSQSPFDVSWHEFFKQACLAALEPFTKDGKVDRV